jgi:hypothetical protein
MNFLACIQSGRTEKVSGREGLRALKLAHQVINEAEV